MKVALMMKLQFWIRKGVKATTISIRKVFSLRDRLPCRLRKRKVIKPLVTRNGN
jgi:hypothetical protein